MGTLEGRGGLDWFDVWPFLHALGSCRVNIGDKFDYIHFQSNGKIMMLYGINSGNMKQAN